MGVSDFAHGQYLTYQSNKNLSFSNYISGVKTAYVIFDEEKLSLLSRNPGQMPDHDFWNYESAAAILEYLKSMGFSDLRYGREGNIPTNLDSKCDLVIIRPTWNLKLNISELSIKYTSCNNDDFVFSYDKKIWANRFQVKSKVFKACQDMYGYLKGYDVSERLKLPTAKTKWNIESVKKSTLESSNDEYAGLYEKIDDPKYTVGVTKTESGYEIIYMNGDKRFGDWEEGELMATISETASDNLYKARWKIIDKSSTKDGLLTFDSGIFSIIVNSDKATFIKTFPTQRDIKKKQEKNNTPTAFGTGFAISNNGYVVTNSHVIHGAKNIFIRGINGNFTSALKCIIVIDDTNNDLAVIKVEDSNFKSLSAIPYNIISKTVDVGTDVFTLGYPLKTIMGDEIKLTNGIISSKTGFNGDITSYQISVPIQPGNSGGPLFDSDGNLIGIVNSVLRNAENVTYAIKSSYLNNLIETLPSGTKFFGNNIMRGQKLSSQSALAKSFVYQIEVN